MHSFKIRSQKLALHCEICHKADCFDPVNNYCTRCSPLLSAFIAQQTPLQVALPNSNYFNYQPDYSFGWLGYVLLPLLLVGVILIIAVPNLLGTRCGSRGASAKEAIRLIHSVQATYYAGVGDGTFGTATDLANQGLIDSVLADACSSKGKPKSGYYFQITPVEQNVGQEAKFTAIAISVDIKSNPNNFYVDETGVIRYCNAPFIPNSTSLPIGN